jgi:hypothetical protein
VVIGFCCGWLIEKGKMFAAPGPWLKPRVENFTESKRSIVKGKAAGSAVVTVKITLAVPNTLSIGH